MLPLTESPEATSSANACQRRFSGWDASKALRSPRRAKVPVTSSIIGSKSGPRPTSPQAGSAGQAAIDCGLGDADRGQHAPVGHLRAHQRKPVVDVIDGGDDGQPAAEVAAIPAAQEVDDDPASRRDDKRNARKAVHADRRDRQLALWAGWSAGPGRHAAIAGTRSRRECRRSRPAEANPPHSRSISLASSRAKESLVRTCTMFSSISRAANSSQTRCQTLPTNGG